MCSAYRFICMQIKLIFVWKFSHEDSFEKEVQGNSEMAYLNSQMELSDVCMVLLHNFQW